MEKELQELSKKRGIPEEVLKEYNVLKFKDESHLEEFVKKNNNYKDLLEFRENKSLYEGYLVVDFLDKKRTQVIMVVRYNSKSVAKYINHRSKKYNPYYKNSKILGLDKINYESDYIVIVEGVFDYIHLSSYGYNVVSVLGSKIGDYHTLLFDRFKRVYLCFDTDNTGRKSIKEIMNKYDNIFQLDVKYISDKYLEDNTIKDVDELLLKLREKYSKIDIKKILDSCVK